MARIRWSWSRSQRAEDRPTLHIRAFDEGAEAVADTEAHVPAAARRPVSAATDVSRPLPEPMLVALRACPLGSVQADVEELLSTQ